MRREYFGLLGSSLSDAELAKFVVLAGAAPRSLRALVQGKGSRTSALDRIRRVFAVDTGSASAEPSLRIALPTVRRVATDVLSIATPDKLRALVSQLWAALDPQALAPIPITVVGAPDALDRQWLAEILGREVGAVSVVFESRRPSAGRWDWPLRIGLPDTPAGQRLYEELRSARYAELYSPVVVGPDERHVDLLLLPSSLATAAGAPLQGDVVADAVLVLGEAEMPAAESSEQLKKLLTRHNGGMSGVCFVPREERLPWIQTLVRELSHDSSLPDSIFEARSGDARQFEGGSAVLGILAAPVLLGDADFVRSTRIHDAARRFATSLQTFGPLERIVVEPSLLPSVGATPATDSAAELGEALQNNLQYFGWNNESGDATTLVRLRRQLEPQLGSLATPPREVAAARSAPRRSDERKRVLPPDFDLPATSPDDEPRAWAPPPPAPEPMSPPRHVQAKVTPLASDETQTTGGGAVVLQPDRDYRLRMHIGAIVRHDGTVVADEALDESLLPPSRRGHELKIVYCPLSSASDGSGGQVLPPPAQAMVHLGEHGDSSHAEFVLRCGNEPRQFRARVIMAHQNRVLQTLLLAADEQGSPRLTAENFYASELVSPSAERPADIAIVVNDNSQGVSGLTTMLPDSVSFLEPDGLKAAIHQMRLKLSTAVVAAVGARDPALDAEETLKLMVALANHGAMILDEIRRCHKLERIDSAERVQVVEAVDKAYFPVEFLYSGLAPRLDAKLCPNAASALAGDSQQIHMDCPHRKQRDYVCPAAFWGFQKCIERHASNGQQAHVVSVPVAGEDQLGPFKCALVAASDRARSEMKGPKGVPGAVGKHVTKVSLATSWAQWRTAVTNELPDLMVLLPHSQDSEAIPGIPILEVSLDNLLSSHLDREFVQAAGASGKGPLVLLLGCSTMLAETPFLNFVRRFNLAGAPIVIGTLSTIHGTQAALVASRLLVAISDPMRSAVRFDEAILKVKRELLAEGHPVAFSLVTYGHSSWRI